MGTWNSYRNTTEHAQSHVCIVGLVQCSRAGQQCSLIQPLKAREMTDPGPWGLDNSPAREVCQGYRARTGEYSFQSHTWSLLSHQVSGGGGQEQKVAPGSQARIPEATHTSTGSPYSSLSRSDTSVTNSGWPVLGPPDPFSHPLPHSWTKGSLTWLGAGDGCGRHGPLLLLENLPWVCWLWTNKLIEECTWTR